MTPKSKTTTEQPRPEQVGGEATTASDADTCPKCGKPDCSHAWEIDAPAAPERGDQPKLIDQLLDAAIYAEDIDRRVAARVRIVKLFDHHSTLITQREQLTQTLRAACSTLKSYQYGNVSPELAKEMIRTIEQVITTSEQEGKQ